MSGACWRSNDSATRRAALRRFRWQRQCRRPGQRRRGTTSAQYEYGPFGEVLRATGPMAKANPFRFSTKYQDDETDLLYYGYRYYNASTGRWICRDPNQDLGFRKQFYVKAFGTMKPSKTHARTADANSLFCANTPLNTFDIVGLCTPGDMNAACVVRVVPSGMNVNVKQTLAGLAALASETELFGMVYESGLQTAASTFTSLAGGRRYRSWRCGQYW